MAGLHGPIDGATLQPWHQCEWSTDHMEHWLILWFAGKPRKPIGVDQ